MYLYYRSNDMYVCITLKIADYLNLENSNCYQCYNVVVTIKHILT